MTNTQNKVTIDQQPRIGYRNVGRPAPKWGDDTVKVADSTRGSLAQDRDGWHKIQGIYPAVGKVELWMMLI